MIVFTAITALATWAGVYVARGQLQVMSDAAPDTAKLIQANRDLAEAAKRQAENTGKLVDAANRSAKSAQDTASAAQGQLAEMQAEQRPVISIATIEANSDFLVESGVAGLGIKFTLKNAGRSTASYVLPVGSLFERDLDSSATNIQRKVCIKGQRARRSLTTGITIFPGDTAFEFAGFSMHGTDFDKWKKTLLNQGALTIAGCIDYVWKGNHYSSGFLIEVDKRGAGENSFQSIDPSEGNIGKANIVFGVNPGLAATSK